MLRDIIQSTRLTPTFCASLVGVSSAQFTEWLDGIRPVPSFVIPELATVLGVAEKDLAAPRSEPSPTDGKYAPAIWYKLRGHQLTDLDREMVGLVRKLGFYLHQLQSKKNQLSLEYIPIFAAVKDRVDKKAPPSVQGREAAAIFRSVSGFNHGQSGIGELIRPFIRRLGILLVESPLKKSDLEGCSFTVGTGISPTACVFANSYKSTWFRRNAVLLHELGHAIFDIENDAVSLDFRSADAMGEETLFAEARVQAFAQNVLVPGSFLKQLANRFGIHWNHLSAKDLGQLVASSHAEQRLVLTAALDEGFIDDSQRELYLTHHCDEFIREGSTHALSTREYLRHRTEESPKWIAENRNTEIGTRKLRLPVGYVDEVINALNADEISLGKAAEMMMMQSQTFYDRFRDLIKETD